MLEEKKEPQKEVEESPTEDGEKRVEIPAKFKEIVQKIEEMSVLDLSELVKLLEKKFGVSAAPLIVGATATAAAHHAEATEEKTEFKVLLKEVGDSKINVIKAVREITGKGLKEAKDLVDATPQVVKEGVNKEVAEELQKKLGEAGATVELQ